MRSPLERSAAAAISPSGRLRPGDGGGRQHLPRRVVEPVERTREELADDPAAVGGAHELLDEQRIAAGPGVQLDGIDGVDRAVDRAGRFRRRELAHRVDVEPTEGDHPRRATQVVQAGHVRLAVPAGGDERNRCVVHGPGQVLEHPDGGRVGPVQVLEDDQRRRARRQRLGQRFEVVPSTLLGRDREVAERLDAERAVDSAPELHRLPPGPVGLAPQHPHAPGPRDRRSLVRQTGLADAGLADDQRETGPARSRGVERRLQAAPPRDPGRRARPEVPRSPPGLATAWLDRVSAGAN